MDDYLTGCTLVDKDNRMVGNVTATIEVDLEEIDQHKPRYVMWHGIVSGAGAIRPAKYILTAPDGRSGPIVVTDSQGAFEGSGVFA
jgi:hypothetical protein